MPLFSVFDIAGSGMSAQTLRLTTTASNMSNAEIAASSPEKTYRARYPVFEAVRQEAFATMNEQAQRGVKVNGIIESDSDPRKQFQPGHAMADDNGYVYYPNVSVVEEMTNMISASRSYQMNAQVINTAKQMMLRTLQLGQ